MSTSKHALTKDTYTHIYTHTHTITHSRSLTHTHLSRGKADGFVV